jgi:iron-sulfur cluster repair protein YtfE (RIC family)
MSFVQARPRATHDFYAMIHKALRRASGEMLVRLGSCDHADPASVEAVIAGVEAHVQLSEMHMAKEDAVIHPALEERAPGAAAGLHRDHEHHRQAFDELHHLIAEVRTAGQDPKAALRALYLRFSLFVADDFAHMADEEQLILPVLQSLFTDAELIEMEDRIRAALSPDQMMQIARNMIPAATPAERAGMMAGVRASAPPPVFDALMNGCARPTLSADEYARLCADVGVPA